MRKRTAKRMCALLVAVSLVFGLMGGSLPVYAGEIEQEAVTAEEMVESQEQEAEQAETEETVVSETEEIAESSPGEVKELESEEAFNEQDLEEAVAEEVVSDPETSEDADDETSLDSDFEPEAYEETDTSEEEKSVEQESEEEDKNENADADSEIIEEEIKEEKSAESKQTYIDVLDGIYYGFYDGHYYISGYYSGTETDIQIPGMHDGYPTCLDGYVFHHNSNITNVTIEDGLTKIGEEAFFDCNNLRSVTIPDSVTEFGNDAFGACTSLTSVTIPTGMTYIGRNAFHNCTHLKNVTIPNNVKEIESGAFMGCGIERINISSLEAWLSIDDHYSGLFGNLYLNGEVLSNLTIPNGTTQIRSNAFRNFTMLTNVTIPNGVTSIGDGAFRGCTSLTSVTIPNSVTSIGPNAFRDCTSLTSVTIPDSVTSIEYEAFNGCNNISRINITSLDAWLRINDDNSGLSGVLYINGEKLTDITIPDSITDLRSSAFEGCTSLTRVIIPNSVTSIGYMAFRGCTNLTSVTIPDSLTSINNWAFLLCTSLTSVTIPDSVTRIGYNAFYGCNNINRININSLEGWLGIDNDDSGLSGDFYLNGEKITSITLPDGITDLKQCAFFGWTSLTSVTIPDSVTSIGYKAFSNCPSLVLNVYTGSYALEYAINNGIEYRIICKTHSWDEDYTVDKEATCSEEGSESIHCSVCGAIDESTVRAIPKKEHSYGEWTTVQEATCTEAGSREKVCGNCGDKVTEEIPVTEHQWNEDYTVDKEATCSEEGFESIHCTVCGAINESTVRAIPKKEHSYGEWTIVQEATCTEAGSREKVCGNCGDKVTEEIPVIEHQWDEEYTVDKEATCTEEGSESIHCSVCGAIDQSTVRAIPKKEHSYGEWTTVQEATCTEAGSREKVCGNCGDKVTEEIPAAGHQWNEEYTVDIEPTETEEGLKSIHCAVCDAVKEGSGVPIPMLAKDLNDLTITGIVNKTYTGKAVTQKPVIKDGDKTLVQNTDYTVTYQNNIDPGTATMTIQGKGGYIGTVIRTFLVLPGKTSRGDLFNLASGVKVTWKEVPGAKYYKVYREGVTDPGESVDEPVFVTSRLYGYDSKPGLTNGNAYRYRIVASLTKKDDPSGDSTLSYSKLMYCLKTVAIRSANNTEPGKVTVKFDKTTSGDGYVLQYSENEDMSNAKTKVIPSADTTTCVLGGFKKGKTIYVSIRVRKAVNKITYYTTFGTARKVVIKK